MSEVGVVFKEFFDFAIGGKTWTLGRPNMAVERAFAKHCEKADMEAIQRHRESMDRLSYAVLMEGWLQGSGSGNKYGWNTPGFLAALASEANQIHLMTLWFGEFYNARKAMDNGQDPAEYVVTEKQMRKFWGDREAQANLVKLLNEALSDPNPLPPST